MGKIIKITIVIVLGISLSIGVGYGFAKYKYNKNSQQANQNLVAKPIQNQSNNSQGKLEATKIKNTKENINSIEGIDIYPLTKEQFMDAVEKGKKHKNDEKMITAQKIIRKSSNNEIMACQLKTPYLDVANISQKLAKQYKESSLTEIAKEAEIGLNNYLVGMMVQGNDIDFYKNIHLVLKLYNSDDKLLKIVQPNEELHEKRDSLNSKEEPINSLREDSNYEWRASIVEFFSAKEIAKYNPVRIEATAVFPDGHENSHSFVLSEVNKL